MAIRSRNVIRIKKEPFKLSRSEVDSYLNCKMFLY